MSHHLHSAWSILGIVETRDAAAIRKAYAIKLKTTRPEQDPAGFQKLAEARELVLAWAKDAVVADSITMPLRREEPSTKPQTRRPKKPPPVILEQPRRSPDRTRNTHLDAAMARACAWLNDRSGTLSDVQPVDLVKLLSQASIVERNQAERRLIAAVQNNLSWQAHRKQKAISKWFDPYNHFILALDGLFDWKNNDRALSAGVEADGTDIADYLQNLRNFGSVHAPFIPQPGAQTTNKSFLSMGWFAKGFLFFWLGLMLFGLVATYLEPDKPALRDRPLIVEEALSPKDRSLFDAVALQQMTPEERAKLQELMSLTPEQFNEKLRLGSELLKPEDNSK